MQTGAAKARQRAELGPPNDGARGSLRGGRRRRRRRRLRRGRSSRGRIHPSLLLASLVRSLHGHKHATDAIEQRGDTSQSACSTGREAGNDERRRRSRAANMKRERKQSAPLFSAPGVVSLLLVANERELQEKRVRVPSWSRCLVLYASSGVGRKREMKRKWTGRSIEFFLSFFARSDSSLTLHRLVSLVLRRRSSEKKKSETCPWQGRNTLSLSLGPTPSHPSRHRHRSLSTPAHRIRAERLAESRNRARILDAVESRVLGTTRRTWPPPSPRRGTPPGSASSRRATTAVARTLWRMRQLAT